MPVGARGAVPHVGSWGSGVARESRACIGPRRAPVEFWKTQAGRGRRDPSRARTRRARIDHPHPGGDGAWRASAPGASCPASPAWPLSLLKRAVGVFEGGDKNRLG